MKNPDLLNQGVTFVSKLLFILALVFGLHALLLYLFSFPLLEHHIIMSYGLNYVTTVLVYVFLLKLKQHHAESLGFIFMGGSMMKFMVFLLFLYPFYKSDGVISRIEFFTFFVPYSCCLVIEIFSFAKVLKEESN